MKLNLLIRTFVISNLYLSLFDIPNKISSSFVELYVHNDNPDAKEEFTQVIEEFTNKYPDYIIHTIQEEENQQMFMSQFNMIPYYNKSNQWSMLLDDDDQLHSDIESKLNLIFSTSPKVCLKYRCIVQKNDLQTSAWYLWHRIYPTEVLNQFYEKKDQVIKYLIDSIGTTKLSYWEDEIFCKLCNKFTGIETQLFDNHMIIHNKYEHTVGYPLGCPKCTLFMPKVMKLRRQLLNELFKINHENIL